MTCTPQLRTNILKWLHQNIRKPGDQGIILMAVASHFPTECWMWLVIATEGI
jgi:hypothetical protein